MLPPDSKPLGALGVKNTDFRPFFDIFDLLGPFLADYTHLGLNNALCGSKTA